MRNKKILWLVRHGQTIENIENICQGQTPGTLTEKGIAQMQELGENLSAQTFDIIYTSDLKRAVDSARLICEMQQGPVRLIEDKRLRERYFGSFQGMKFPEDRTSFNYPDDVESFEQMGERLSSFLQDLLYSETDEHVLIVTHGVALRVLLSLLLSGDTAQTDYFPSLKNASVTRVETENGKVTDLRFEPINQN